jgi:putative DNA primase/helicase
MKELADVLSAIISKEKRFVTMDDTEEIYCYDNGIYSGKAENIIRGETEKKLKEVGLSHLSTRHLANEVVGHIQRNTFNKRENLESAPNFLCLQNGIFNLETMGLQPCSADYFFVKKLPLYYEIDARCPRFERFIQEIVETKHVSTIQELLGYCLYRNYKFQSLIMLMGEGSNGKSTLLNVLEAMVGAENCSNISLQKLVSDKFAVSQLFGKLVNKYADLESADIEQTSTLKMLTGEDSIYAQEKFRPGFNFKNYAKMIFSCNTLPKTKDRSDAFYRRWIIIPFTKKFEGINADKNLLTKLTTKEELSGIFNFSLVGLKRLLKQGYFTGAMSTDEVRDMYDRLSDPIRAFQLDRLYTAADASIEKDRLYDEYVKYSHEKCLPLESKIKFSKRLKEQICVRDYFPKIGGKQKECWMGVRLKDEIGDEKSNQLTLNNTGRDD